MKGMRIPNIIRSADHSITLTYEKPKYSLIWLHGLCADAQSFLSFFTHSRSPLYYGTRVKLIQAPNRYVTINNDFCNSWYDLKSLKRFTLPENEVFNFEEVQQSAKIIGNHVKEEILFWEQNNKSYPINPIHRVYVGGFSQGGVMALHYSLTAAEAPAGAIGFSSYLLKYTKTTNLKILPTLLSHGNEDSVIKQIEAKNSYKKILEDQHLVSYTNYPKLDHSVCLQQLDLLKDWLSETHSFIDRHYKK